MRRALLIGSQTHGLAGVHHDLHLMDEALGLFGFERTSLMGADASRDGIIAGLRQLVADTEAGDASLIYYSGHGGLVANPHNRTQTRDGAASHQPAEPRFYQYLVPTDHTRESFRGLFSSELAAILSELTAKTTNVTSILDCCHSARMLRGDTFQPKALPGKPWIVGIEEHVRWLREQGYDLSARAAYVEGNPNVVRLAACMSSQTAYEYTTPDGASGGVMTQALVKVLQEVHKSGGALPTWDAIGARIKTQVQERLRAQQPSLAGPIGRVLLSLDSAPTTDIFTYSVSPDGSHMLKAGSLHGIAKGDRFLIMPLNAGVADHDLALAEAEAIAVTGHVSKLKASRLPGRPPPPNGARAFRYKANLTRHPVRLCARIEGLEKAIAEAPRLAVASGEQAPIASVVTNPDDAEALIEILDESGRLVGQVATDDLTVAITTLIATLEQLARAHELLHLKSGQNRAKLQSRPAIEWGKVVDEKVSPLPLHGAELAPGDRIYVRVTNTHRLPLYISVLGIGVSRSIHLLTQSEPEGIELCAAEHLDLGADDQTGQFFGIPVVWPPQVPKRDPQPMVIVIIASDMPCDLRSLESDVLSILQLVTERPVVHRDFGDVPPPRARSMRYVVSRIEFAVQPS